MIALFDASVDGEAINGNGVTGKAANDASFCSIELFIALLTLAGITVVDGSTGGFITDFVIQRCVILFP